MENKEWYIVHRKYSDKVEGFLVYEGLSALVRATVGESEKHSTRIFKLDVSKLEEVEIKTTLESKNQ